MKIYKVDGCAHMVCQKCRHEFCWICLGKYPSYVHTGDDTICGLRVFTLTFLYAFGFIMLMSYNLYSDNWVSWILRSILSFIFKFLCTNIFFFSIFLTLVFARLYAEQTIYGRTYTCCEKLTTFFWALMTISFPMVWGASLSYLYYNHSKFSFLLTYMYYEVLTVLGIIAVVII